MTRESATGKAAIARPRRTRRSTEEIIERILEAASEEFKSNGYAGTTTAAIAKRAGVAEPLIFKHFGSKAGLFQSAIFKPLNQHLQDFLASHMTDRSDKATLRENTFAYIEELQRFIEQHSRLLTSMLAIQFFENDSVHGMGQIKGLDEFFARTTEAVMSRQQGKPTLDVNLLSRISFATLLGCVIFRDWLFPQGQVPDEATINEAVCSFVMDGFNASSDA